MSLPLISRAAHPKASNLPAIGAMFMTWATGPEICRPLLSTIAMRLSTLW